MSSTSLDLFSSLRWLCLLEVPHCVPGSQICLQAESQKDGIVHLICFLSLRYSTSVLFAVQCLKTVVSYFLSGFLIVYGGRIILVLLIYILNLIFAYVYYPSLGMSRLSLREPES